jgi:hypothetical protein
MIFDRDEPMPEPQGPSPAPAMVDAGGTAAKTDKIKRSKPSLRVVK